MKLVVGLGNPGKNYEKTRHNIGYQVIDVYAKSVDLNFVLDKTLESFVASKNIDGEKVILIKPITYMNLSGVALVKVMQYYKINIEDVLVIVDDIYLDVGRLRLREKGGHGGQNGLKSIERYLHSRDYKRIKIGIGLDEDKPLDHYVLSPFSKKEQPLIEESIIKASQAIEMFIHNQNFTDIMTKYNTQS